LIGPLDKQLKTHFSFMARRYFAGKDVFNEQEDGDSENSEEEKVKPRKKERVQAFVRIDTRPPERHEAISVEKEPEHVIPTKVQKPETESEESEEEPEEVETDDESGLIPMSKPVFLSSKQRQPPAADEESGKTKTSHRLIQLDVEREMASKNAGKEVNENMESVDDTDGLDAEQERMAWKVRELRRVKREREAMESREAEREEVERRRGLNEEAKWEEDKEYLEQQKLEQEESRGGLGFMQKYYHRGAFYQDQANEDAGLFRRNYNARKEDEIRRELLPKIMQVRGEDFGKKGRSKYTHLADQDTSRGNTWGAASLNKRNESRIAGHDEQNPKRLKRAS
jgi:microfibrillar-associated protein 1